MGQEFHPTPEQDRAIKAVGSVLLKAGAGAGKTAVLVNHIIHRLEKKVKNKEKIKEHFSKTTLITFTRKSTAEMRRRTREELEKKEGDYWEGAVKNIKHLNIDTIDGFCTKLLKSGLLSGKARGGDIMDSFEQKIIIKELFNRWFSLEKEKMEEELCNIIMANYEAIEQVWTDIFNDAFLRRQWVYSDGEGVEQNTLLEWFKKHTKPLLLNRVSLGEEGKNQKWRDTLQNWNKLLEKEDLNSFRGLMRAYNFLQGKRLVPPTKYPEINKYFQFLQNFKGALFKKWDEDITAFIENKSVFRKWNEVLRKAFLYIDQHYRKNSRLSYADLEFYVWEGLQDKSAVERVSRQYRYIVVDEFQDTSPVQFDIIKKIIEEDYGRLFVVGDGNQAIYGFRGGDATIFNDAKEVMENNLAITANFRSQKTIVKFTSSLFDFNFKQTHREEEDQGVVQCHKVNIIHQDFLKKSLSKKELEEMEAKKIFDLLCSLEKESGTEREEVAILYRNLEPSLSLIKLLLKHQKMTFTAQIKIVLPHDPVMAMARVLLEYCLFFYQQKGEGMLSTYPLFVISSYLGHMGFTIPDNLEKNLEKFISQVQTFGFIDAFAKFIHSLSLANTGQRDNFSTLVQLFNLFGEDLERVYQTLSEQKVEKDSLDVSFGQGKGKNAIIIQTVHRAKGLEFDRVILGGVHTNNSKKPNHPYVGKIPGALKWKTSSTQKDFFKSPNLIWEREHTDEKNKKESQRLFYVASTRARRGLYWIDLYLNNKEQKTSSESKDWISDLRNWVKTGEKEGINFVQREEEEPLGLTSSNSTTPIFQLNEGRLATKKSIDPLLLLPSRLWISNFSTLADCPQKFYLETICRFEENSIPFTPENVPSSNKERGKKLHEKIAAMIKDNWSDLAALEESDEREQLMWVKDSLKEFYGRGNRFLPEKGLALTLFGQSITGKADLLILGDDEMTIWDFKTGRKGTRTYDIQLTCYAYGFAHQYKWDRDKPIQLALAYIDQKEIKRWETTPAECETILKEEWKKLSKLSLVNLEHCPICPYNSLCNSNNQ